MWLAIFLIIGQFSVEYERFIESSKSDEIFIDLIRGTSQISDFSDDPVVLWYWRTNTNSQEADSFLMKIPMRNNFNLSAVLRWEAIEQEEYEAQINKMRMAIHFDSSGVENFISLLALGVKKRDFSVIQSALSLPVLTDFRSQLFLITNMAILLIASLFLCTVIFVLVKTVHYLPVISHRIGPRQPAQWMDIIKTLILLIPILVLRNLYIAFICYTILLTFVLSRREKNWLRVSLLGLLIMYILSLPLGNFITFLTQNNYHYQLYELVHYDTSLRLNPEDTDHYKKQFVAYGLKKQNKLEESLSIYEDLYYGGSRDVAVINNLANIYYEYDENALAETLYYQATNISSRGEPFFNMGLLKLRNIEYSESSRYMEEARQHGFSSLNKEPVDIEPSNKEFFALLFSEKLSFVGIIDFIYVIPVIIALIITFLPLHFSPPLFCTTCGRAVCSRCIKEIGDEILCTQCFTKFKSTKQAEIEEDLRIAVNRNRKRTRRITMYLLNILIPGAGLVYHNRHISGLFFIFIMMLVYIPLILPTLFVKPVGYIAFPFRPIFVTTAIIAAVFSYILSFALLRDTDAN